MYASYVDNLCVEGGRDLRVCSVLLGGSVDERSLSTSVLGVILQKTVLCITESLNSVHHLAFQKSP
jgi:hypothetical protein